MNAALAGTNTAHAAVTPVLARTNAVFVGTNAALDITTDLPQAQSSSPLVRTNAAFNITNHAFDITTHLPCFQSRPLLSNESSPPKPSKTNHLHFAGKGVAPRRRENRAQPPFR